VDPFVHHKQKRGYGHDQQYFRESDPERCAGRPMSEDRWQSKQRKTKGDQDKRDNVPDRRLRPTWSPVDD
jgi:hypothetical protein